MLNDALACSLSRSPRWKIASSVSEVRPDFTIAISVIVFIGSEIARRESGGLKLEIVKHGTQDLSLIDRGYSLFYYLSGRRAGPDDEDDPVNQLRKDLRF